MGKAKMLKFILKAYNCKCVKGKYKNIGVAVILILVKNLFIYSFLLPMDMSEPCVGFCLEIEYMTVDLCRD